LLKDGILEDKLDLEGKHEGLENELGLKEGFKKKGFTPTLTSLRQI